MLETCDKKIAGKAEIYQEVQLAFSLWFFSVGIQAEARKALTSNSEGGQLTRDQLTNRPVNSSPFDQQAN